VSQSFVITALNITDIQRSLNYLAQNHFLQSRPHCLRWVF